MEKQQTQVTTLCFCGHVDVGKSTLVGRILNMEVPDMQVKEYAKLVDIEGEIKQKNKGATQNYACNQISLFGSRYCVIDNPGHLEYLHQLARSLHLADILILICQADKLQISIAYCKLIKFIANNFANIQKTVLIINKIDLNPNIDIQQIKLDLQADISIEISIQMNDQQFADNIQQLLSIQILRKQSEQSQIILFDQDICQKQGQVYIKNMSDSLLIREIDKNSKETSLQQSLLLKEIDRKSLDKQYLKINEQQITQLESFSQINQNQANNFVMGEYLVGQIKQQVQLGLYNLLQNKLVPVYSYACKFRISAKSNRRGLIAQLGKYTAYSCMQYFECNLQGKDTIRPIKAFEQLLIDVYITSKLPVFVDLDNKIVLFNMDNRNPLVLIGQINQIFE